MTGHHCPATGQTVRALESRDVLIDSDTWAELGVVVGDRVLLEIGDDVIPNWVIADCRVQLAMQPNRSEITRSIRIRRPRSA